MAFLKALILFIVTEQCFDEYFVLFNFFHVECFKSTLSKLLGFGLIAGSVLVKLPQILKITRNQSGEGLSLPSLMLELTAITIHASYNFVSRFPFVAWGDGAMLGIQTVIITYFVLYYGGYAERALTFVVVYCIICFVTGTMVPIKILWFLQACNVPILMGSKALQVWENYKNGSTGQLAAATVFAITFGGIARIFTSIQETGDAMMVTTYCASTITNLVLSYQMIHYWNAGQPKKVKTK